MYYLGIGFLYFGALLIIYTMVFFIAEVGKGNVNWFNEASRQPVKHDTGNNSQATDTDIRLSQKTKASSQQHEQFRHDNCQPAVNTISTKIVDGKKKVLVNY
jgi:hypothetical protein